VDIGDELFEQLTIRTKTVTLVGLVAIAAGLIGCGGARSTAAASPSPAPASSASSPAASSVEAEIVTTANAATVGADVAASTLPSLDKNRFAAFLDDHQTITNAYDGKTVREVINLQISYEVALQLAEQARRDDLLHKQEIAKLIASDVTIVQERPHSIVLHMDLQNLTAKPIKTLEIGLTFVGAKDAKEIGLAEVHLVRNIAGKGRISFDYPMRWVRFGSDTGPMMAAIGQPKKLVGQVTEIKYADGTDAGFDD